MTKLDKDYQKIPRCKELVKTIESFWARPLKSCDKIMIDIAEKHYMNNKTAAFNAKLINEMYCIN